MAGNQILSEREALFERLIEHFAEALPERLTLETRQDFIYLSDLDTYELYLISVSDWSELPAVWHDYQGKKCYEVLQGRDAPCPFCTNRLLDHDIDYIWRFHNHLTGGDYILKDRLVDWNGKTVRMEVVIDVSDSSRIEDVLQRSMENQNILTGCLHHLIGSPNVRQGCEGVLEMLGQFFGAASGGISCVEPRPLHVCWKTAASPPPVSQTAVMRWNSRLSRGQQVVLTDVEQLRERNEADWKRLRGAGVRSLCATPVFVRGALAGFAYLTNLTAHWSELALLTMLAGYIGTLLEKEALEADKLRLQYYDTLANCPNFEGFKREVAVLLAERTEERFALWYCDIKKFKYVNDMLGYDVGDRLLRHWSRVLQEGRREGETYGRVSGDNFVALCRYETQEELTARFARMVKALSVFRPTAAQKYPLDVVVGVYCITGPDEVRTLDEMLNYANMAQKSVKALSGSRIAFYDDTMRRKVVRDLQLEAAMGDALKSEAFELFLQPQISLRGKEEALHAEALVRWRQPDGGLLQPGEFIELFERDGMIAALDRYMFERACRFLRDWSTRGRLRLCVAINISRVTMLQADFVEELCRIKSQYGVPDGALELEFTETVVVENYDSFRGIVDRLRQSGFLCAVDDFGTCQSSLNLLRNLPFDVLKLDRQFFQQDGDPVRGCAVVESVLRLARDLEMQTVAEGVETPLLVRQLREIGCDRVQGFVFSHPVPAREFIARSDEALLRGN